MPLNAGAEYFVAQQKYLDAKTKEEKIRALEEMIRACPKHKSAENTLKELKSKLAKLKKQKQAKVGRHAFSLQKLGDAQVCILGMTQTGKSTLLSKLTNAKPKISNVPFTTKKPRIGMIEWKGVKIQLVEIPSTFQNIYMNVAQTCDGIIIAANNEKEEEGIKKVIDDFRVKAPSIMVKPKDEIEIEDLKKRIWDKLGLIRIYTKEPGKKPEKKALVLRKGSTVKDAARKVHKDFVKFFKFARVWGKSAKHDGQSFGMEHVLKDDDIVEFHMKK